MTGIGFTMSLFVGTFAFDDVKILGQIRLALPSAPALTTLLGSILLWSAKTG